MIINIEAQKKYDPRYDILTVITVLLDSGAVTSEHGLLGLLELLFSKKPLQYKKDRLENTFNIPMTRTLEKGVQEMCNVSDFIEERAIASGLARGIQQGIEQGIAQGIEQSRRSFIINCVREGLADDQISRIARADISEIQKIKA